MSTGYKYRKIVLDRMHYVKTMEKKRQEQQVVSEISCRQQEKIARQVHRVREKVSNNKDTGTGTGAAVTGTRAIVIPVACPHVTVYITADICLFT